MHTNALGVRLGVAPAVAAAAHAGPAQMGACCMPAALQTLLQSDHQQLQPPRPAERAPGRGGNGQNRQAAVPSLLATNKTKSAAMRIFRSSDHYGSAAGGFWPRRPGALSCRLAATAHCLQPHVTPINDARPSTSRRHVLHRRRPSRHRRCPARAASHVHRRSQRRRLGQQSN